VSSDHAPLSRAFALTGNNGEAKLATDFTAADLKKFAPNGLADYLDYLAGAGKAILQAADILDTSLRLRHFMAQIAEETGGFTIKVESLTYTHPERLMEVWPKRFPTVESAQPYVKNGVALGDKVYGGRMGNTDPGDGFKYRGRGFLQTTGREAYRRFGEMVGVDLEANPDEVANPATSLRCATAEWTGSKINVPADADDLSEVTLRVNGGLTGLPDRQVWLTKAEGIFV
jgi:predicted chitinase